MENRVYNEICSNRRWKTIFGFSIIITISVFLIFCMRVNADGTGEDYPAPKDDDWIVDSETQVWNETIVLNGNLSIDDSGNLSFRNVTLIMNCSEDGEYGIVVNDGGGLYILDYDNDSETNEDRSNITANDTEFEFKFLVDEGTKFEMKNSELSECGYTWYGEEDGRYGLTIKTNNTIIENSS